MRPPFFVTTPIFYVNDVPHIGHAYTVIAADAVARYRRMAGADVFFLTGTDEHGQKIEKAAEGRGESPQAMTDRLSSRFQDLWARLGISHDHFVRTTEPRHKEAVHALYRKLEQAGDIYEGGYEGWYCVPCESFWTELQLAEGNCPDCGRAVERVTEASYFFRLSAFSDRLLAHIGEHPEFITPRSRRNEVVAFIKGGLRDLSISRTGVKWGIPLPDNPGHVIYVWLDALVNYLTATGFPNPGFENRWPAQVHIIGKDILRFHAVYWPSFLLSAGLPLPERIVSHGWWTIDGEKMSKSRGNVVDPGLVAEHFGVDALRYFLLREIPFGQDGNFSINALVTRCNTDLANDLGNLLSRTVSMLHRYLGGTVPKPAPPAPEDTELVDAIGALADEVEVAMRELAFDRALAAIWERVGEANRYVDKCAPWNLAKRGETERLQTVLYHVLEFQRILSLFLYPVMPATAERIWAQLGQSVDPTDVDLEAASRWGGLAPDTELPKAEPLFPRIDPDTVPATLTITKSQKEPDKVTDQPAPEVPASPEDDFISIHDFAKVRLQVGQVKEAEAVKKSNKLLKLQVDIGDETRQVIAGIGRKYTPEEMVGKRVVVVTNLRPAKLMGETSEGMILAAGTDEVLALLAPSEDVPAGARIK